VSTNLDLVRSLFADWERGDFGRDDWADPEIDFVIVGGPTPSRFHGIPGMARGMREFLSAWEGYRIEAYEYGELDHVCILIFTRDTARGRTSGVDTVRMRAYALQLGGGGKVTRITSYYDRESALADLGLEN
jgi:hypothetical protein